MMRNDFFKKGGPVAMLVTLKKLSARSVIAVLSITVLSQFTSGCLTFRMSPKQFDEYYTVKFPERPRPSLGFYEAEGRRIQYASAGNDSLPMIIFVHGSPGAWSAFQHYLEDSSLLARAFLVSVDRPGFGYSGYGQAEPSLERQSAMMKPLVMMSKSDVKPILVGHSLGGPLIARMAMDYPELVGGLVMLAPSIAPELEPSTWYRHILRLPLIRQMIPKSFIASNDEILPLKGELEQMMPLWPNITAPVVVVQGTVDNLVAPGNADFAKEQLTNAPCELVMLENVNHFIPWSHYGLIVSLLHKQLTQNDGPLSH